ncbi:MAG: hypothetical protein WCD75_15865 [Rhodoplanes sp.]
MKPGKLEVLDIDDTFCAAHGDQQLAFWNAHQTRWFCVDAHLSRGERHAGGGDPAPCTHPQGAEVRTVIKHVGILIYSDFERRGAGAASKFRSFHGVGCSSACGVRFALVFERGIHEHCAVQISTLHPTNA